MELGTHARMKHLKIVEWWVDRVNAATEGVGLKTDIWIRPCDRGEDRRELRRNRSPRD